MHWNKQKKAAVSVLGLDAYNRFTSRLERGISDYVVNDTVDETTNCVIGKEVRSHRYPDAPSQKFKSGLQDQCSCKDRLAEEDMCVHEILMYGFKKELYLQRHMRRDVINGSLGE